MILCQAKFSWILVFRQIHLISSEFDNDIQDIDSFFQSARVVLISQKDTRPVVYTSIFEFRAAFFTVAITLPSKDKELNVS